MSKRIEPAIDASIPRTVPAFLAKLYSMINDASTNKYIHWAEGKNTHFIIRCPRQFSEDMLPLHFKHNNFASFVRQLNMYGFRKVADMSQVNEGVLANTRHTPEDASLRPWEFEHPFLVRGQPNLMLNIQRKSKHGAPASAPAAPASSSRTAIKREHPDDLADELAQLRLANEELKTQMRRLRQENAALVEHVQTIETENTRLWTENSQYRQKLHDQQEATSRIGSFLNSVYTPASAKVSGKRKPATQFIDAGDLSMVTAKRAPSADASAPILETDFVFQPFLAGGATGSLLQPGKPDSPVAIKLESFTPTPVVPQSRFGDDLTIAALASFDDEADNDNVFLFDQNEPFVDVTLSDPSYMPSLGQQQLLRNQQAMQQQQRQLQRQPVQQPLLSAAAQDSGGLSPSWLL